MRKVIVLGYKNPENSNFPETIVVLNTTLKPETIGISLKAVGIQFDKIREFQNEDIDLEPLFLIATEEWESKVLAVIKKNAINNLLAFHPN